MLLFELFDKKRIVLIFKIRFLLLYEKCTITNENYYDI